MQVFCPKNSSKKNTQNFRHIQNQWITMLKNQHGLSDGFRNWPEWKRKQLSVPDVRTIIVNTVHSLYPNSQFRPPVTSIWDLPSFWNLQSVWCLGIVFLGPLKSHPAPAYWHATRVPEHLYLRWSSRLPLCSSSVQESELGHITICLSNNLSKRRLGSMTKK